MFGAFAKIAKTKKKIIENFRHAELGSASDQHNRKDFKTFKYSSLIISDSETSSE